MVAGKPSRLRRVEEIGLDRRFLDAVFAEGTARRRLGGRYCDRRTMDPDRTAMEEVAYLAAEGGDEMLGAWQRETDHVDDDVRLEVADLRPERTGLFLGIAVENDGFDGAPCSIGLIGLPLAARDVDHVVARGNQTRHEIRADVAASAKDHRPRHVRPSQKPVGEKLADFVGEANRSRQTRPAR